MIVIDRPDAAFAAATKNINAESAKRSASTLTATFVVMIDVIIGQQRARPMTMSRSRGHLMVETDLANSNALTAIAARTIPAARRNSTRGKRKTSMLPSEKDSGRRTTVRLTTYQDSRPESTSGRWLRTFGVGRCRFR